MTPELQIHLATPHDAEEIAALSKRLIEHGLPWTWHPLRVAKAIASPNTNTALVRDQRGVMGFGIMEYWDDDAHLVLFAVRPELQRQRIGSAILGWLESVARTAGTQCIRVEARADNIAARSFYNEHGYHELKLAPRMYSGMVDGVRLEKWLRPVNC